MIDEKTLAEKLRLLEREMATLTEKCESLEKSIAALGDVELEQKALKLFITRRHPEFKKEFLEAIEKVKAGGS